MSKDDAEKSGIHPIVGATDQTSPVGRDPLAPISRRDLVRFFTEAARSDERTHMVGTELEKFGVCVPADGGELRPVSYGEIASVLDGLCSHFGWEAGPDHGVAGQRVELRRDGASITLEPGGQLELSGKPLLTIHETCAEFTQHYQELHAVSEPLNMAWFAAGFHPWATREQIQWMPKGRYEVMGSYLPTQGARALDMMLRTCTVQANFDYATELQCGQRLGLANAISPIVMAMFANSPFVEGVATGASSNRSRVWLEVDPARCGTPHFALKGADFRYEDYIEWALDVPMFFVKRNDRYMPYHLPFRAFMTQGFDAPDGVHYHAIWSDWITHLSTVFPEVRLKPFVEFRSVDAVTSKYLCAVPALLKALLYDGSAGAEVWDFLGRPNLEQHMELWAEARAVGLESPRIREAALRLADWACTSLQRNPVLDSKGRSETRFLEPVRELVERGRSPAHEALTVLGQAPGTDPEAQRRFVRAFHFAGVQP